MVNRTQEKRIERGEKQETVSSAIGIGQSTLSEIENGKKIPSVEVALKLARHYGCTVEELFKLGD